MIPTKQEPITPRNKIIIWLKDIWNKYGRRITLVSLVTVGFVALKWGAEFANSLLDLRDRVFAGNTTDLNRPAFQFSLVDPTDLSWNLNLTNDFLLNTNINGEIVKPIGLLLLPKKVGQSNVSINVSVINNSSAVAELGQVCLILPKDWNCSAGEGWAVGRSASSLLVKGEKASTQTWVYRFNSTIPKTGPILTPVTIHLPNSLPLPQGVVSIWAGAKDLSWSGIIFRMGFWQNAESNFHVEKPIVIKGTRQENGVMWDVPPPDEYNVW